MSLLTQLTDIDSGKIRRKLALWLEVNENYFFYFQIKSIYFEQNKMNERNDGGVGLEPSGGTLGRYDLK